MPPSRKKVIARKLSRDWLAGYLSPTSFINGQQLEMLDLEGKVSYVSLVDLKWVCFVRDFNSGEPASPERLLRKTFAGRPRSEGLWLRVRLKDQDVLEGIVANDRSLLDPDGLFLTPPDTRSNTQRIFLPHAAIIELEIVAVIGSPSRRKAALEAPAQESLFPVQK
jgi:hypothetical protein